MRNGAAKCYVTGARTPELRLSLYEWELFRISLMHAYNLLGVDIPMMRNRLRRK